MEFDYNDRVDFSGRPSTAIVQHTNHKVFLKKILIIRIIIIIIIIITIIIVIIIIIKYNKKSHLGKNNVSLKIIYITCFDVHIPGFSLLQILQIFFLNVKRNF